MFLHRSNRTERLVDALAEVARRPLSDPFAPEWIAVPSPGMERFLALELSRRLSVWAQPCFPFPRKLIEDLFSAVLGAPTDAAPYEPSCMALGLSTLLREHAARSEPSQVSHYLALDPSVRRRLALAGRLADLFDQYATYRPEMVLDWQSGKEAHFQAQLLRAFAEQHGRGHVAARARAFLQALASGAGCAGWRLPERVSVFGVSTLPPIYLEVLSALSRRVEVHLFLLSPTREYYGDLRARPARAVQLSFDELATPRDVDTDAAPAGHPLLASLGQHGRELAEGIEGRFQYRESGEDLYEEPGVDSLLHTLQADLLGLVDRGSPGGPARAELAPTDGSLAIHSCHGAMREIEVLRDQLLAMFEDGSTEPHDVIVMTPDIEAYAPMIDAVFSDARGRVGIPFRIADRRALRNFEVVGALDLLLETLSGRMGVNHVLDLLGVAPIRSRFGITAEEVEPVRELLARSGARWGIDAEHRHAVGQPAYEENTLRFALRRLALGYALPDEAEDRGALYLGHAPCAIDPEQADLFGRASELCETLFSLHAECQAPCTLSEWQRRISRVLSESIASDARTAEEHKLCQRAMTTLVDHATLMRFDEPVDLDTLRGLLADAIETRSPPQAFLSAGVTFCQLMPMRSIPFPVVCMIGMNDGAFPASDMPLGFDKMVDKRRQGDRSRRNDDRQLFLEALLSARERLYLSYVGQSIHDNKPLLPSVLVSELVEHVARGFRLPDEEAKAPASEHLRRIEERLTLRHPLAAWSPRYFEATRDPRYVSYARGAYDAACALLDARAPKPPFFTGQTTVAEAPSREAPPQLSLSLDELLRFLQRPVRAFLRRRLGLDFTEVEALQDREPLELGPLARWQVGTELLERLEREGGVGDAGTLLRARGVLPLGTLGGLAYTQQEALARELQAELLEHVHGQRLPVLRRELGLTDATLACVLSQIWPDGQGFVQMSTLGGRHELRAWLRHLALCTFAGTSEAAALPRTTVLVGRGSDSKAKAAAIRFRDVDSPRTHLERFLSLYRTGQEAPLPVHDLVSYAYAKAIVAGESRAKALAAAAAKFASQQGDGAYATPDPDVRTVYPSWDDMLAQREPHDFEGAAMLVYGALHEHRERA